MTAVGHNRLVDLASEIAQAHQESTSAAERAAERAIAAGHLLLEAKALLKHGQWAEWRASNIPDISERTAQRYMRLARSGLKSATVADFGLRASDEALADIAELRHLSDADVLRGIGVEDAKHAGAREVFEFGLLGKVADRLWPGEFEQRLLDAEADGQRLDGELALEILRAMARRVTAPGECPAARMRKEEMRSPRSS